MSSKTIHVAGTKGKGSTCAYTESIIRQYGYKTGLYTSPHLISVLERIKINGRNVDEDIFIKYFWECWYKLESSRNEQYPLMPGWFRFLTLLSFKIFQEEKVDAAIIECGVGGRTDSTNVLNNTTVSGITLLDYDHVDVLGNTLSEIASHKAGIFKKGVPGIIDANQKDEAIATIVDIANKKGTPLYKTRPLQEYLDMNNLKPSDINIKANFLCQNASLSIALADSWLQKHHLQYSVQNIRIDEDAFQNPIQYRLFQLPDEYIIGLSSSYYAGRAQIINLPDYHSKIFLDGAHTIASTISCMNWFLSQSNKDKNVLKVLVFNCNKPRDPKLLLKPMLESIIKGDIEFHLFLFTSSHVEKRKHTDPSNDLTYTNINTQWQHEIDESWNELIKEYENSDIKFPKTFVFPNVNRAFEQIQNTLSSNSEYESAEIITTGSLYLVGSFLEFIEDFIQEKLT